jgi:circadian clock protein KaiC
VIERRATGNGRLDNVLGGGLPASSMTLIAGEPGTGKTILAEQVGFHNAGPDHPVVYCSTVSEPLDKLLRFGDGLTFFDPAVVGTSLLFEDLGVIAAQVDGLSAVLARLDTLLREQRPAVVIIDSFKALRPFADDAATYGRFLHGLSGRFSAQAVSILLLGEYSPSELATAPESAVADTILSLTVERNGYRTTRYIQVIKMRGGVYTDGPHAFRIGHGGLEVFPRIADTLDTSRYDQGIQRVSTGIPVLDELLHDGYWPGASTLVAGPTGSGKTLIGLHFLYGGAAAGEPGILATLQESRMQLAHVVAGYSWQLDTQGVNIYDRSPVGLLVDEWLHELFELVGRSDARRLVVDSIDDLMLAADDDLRFREYMYSLVSRCARQQISLLMTHELPDLYDTGRLSEFGVSHLCDNVLTLQYIPNGDRLDRAIRVLKTRASTHDAARYQFEITGDGIALTGPALPKPT